MSRPNIFKYATKELSQDAVICWLIEWSGAQTTEAEFEPALRELGRAFVEALLATHNIKIELKGDDVSTEIHQQNLGIDVLARVREHANAKWHVLVIEDKTDADSHSNQLDRYREGVSNGDSAFGNVHESSVCYVFLKTGNQSLSKDRCVEEKGYKLFGRRDFLKVLNRYPGGHPIVADFREHLRQREAEFTRYCRWSRADDRSEWSRGAWEGFFRQLEDHLDEPSWGYVSNPRGGFLGFWWHWIPTKADDRLYLQLEIVPEAPKEKQKLCFKVERGGGVDDVRNKDVRNRYHNAILAAGAGAVARPSRMRSARTMTVGLWQGDWLAFGADARLDMDRTVDNLKKAQSIVEKAQGIVEAAAKSM